MLLNRVLYKIKLPDCKCVEVNSLELVEFCTGEKNFICFIAGTSAKATRKLIIGSDVHLDHCIMQFIIPEVLRGICFLSS